MLGDVHTTPARIETVAILVRDIIGIRTLDGFGVTYRLEYPAKIIFRKMAIYAAPVAEGGN